MLIPTRYRAVSLSFALLSLCIGFSQPVLGQEPSAKLLVPAYGNPFNPEGDAMWTQLTETALVMGSDLYVILNPNSGPGASPIDPNYVNEMAEGPLIDLRQAGATVIGYVRTDYTQIPLAQVQDEIDLYLDPSYWRGAGVQIEGIFLDEMSNELADVGYYETLRDYVRNQLPGGLVVGNPGTTFVVENSATFTVAEYAESADILMTFETNANQYFTNYTPPSWLGAYPADRFAHIVYDLDGVPRMRDALSLAIQRKAGFVYLTDDALPNPYDELASYWTEEVEAALGLIFADGFESGGTATWTQSIR